MEAGFEDANYFSSLFKRETQMTPSNYRKKTQKSLILRLIR
ncbi:AraC family transcriptional regulator [Enterococcus mundtii]|nr:AraC family transcriptional regulator [Enterococcus mundtii]